ncbi:MAG TPA: 4Fe-4S dicluster domain-containing protein [Pseudonocardiaceae bacterium]|nr:4Fe-4S dicluster domain-containing protein [Pseudonocardiaceae bacterium]
MTPAPLTISADCTACGACLLTCPEHALRPAPRRPVVLASACTGCGECVEICPTDAITLDGRATLDRRALATAMDWQPRTTGNCP